MGGLRQTGNRVGEGGGRESRGGGGGGETEKERDRDRGGGGREESWASGLGNPRDKIGHPTESGALGF